MQPILIIVISAAASVPMGLWLRQNLATLGYRDSRELDLPAPGPRWWVVWVGVTAIGSLALAAVVSPRPSAYVALFPLATWGSWIAAVDLDVMRIPNRVLAPITLATLLTIVGVPVTKPGWTALVVPAIGSFAAGIVFATVHFTTKGGIGLGDVKLVAVIGLAVGPLGLGAVWLSVLIGSLAALAWARRARRVGPIPYGPWLLLGCWLAALVHPVSGY